jgi:hypothetical protein
MERLRIRYGYYLANAFRRVKEGFALQVTGDIDDPEYFKDLTLLNIWIDLAKKVGTETPILYITVHPREHFERIARSVKGVEIGVHGLSHIDHRTIPTDRLRLELKEISGYSRKFRFPFLARDFRTLSIAAQFFDIDSSITSYRKPFPPFFLNPGFFEYPIIPPSDTFFRGKDVHPKQAASVVAESVERCKNSSMFCTLLLHPNEYVVEMLRYLANAKGSLSN